eukprot:609883-Amphidinium_carterae.3
MIRVDSSEQQQPTPAAKARLGLRLTQVVPTLQLLWLDNQSPSNSQTIRCWSNRYNGGASTTRHRGSQWRHDSSRHHTRQDLSEPTPPETITEEVLGDEKDEDNGDKGKGDTNGNDRGAPTVTIQPAVQPAHSRQRAPSHGSSCSESTIDRDVIDQSARYAETSGFSTMQSTGA